MIVGITYPMFDLASVPCKKIPARVLARHNFDATRTVPDRWINEATCYDDFFCRGRTSARMRGRKGLRNAAQRRDKKRPALQARLVYDIPF